MNQHECNDATLIAFIIVVGVCYCYTLTLNAKHDCKTDITVDENGLSIKAQAYN